MATQQSAALYITNNTDGNAWILLFHTNSSTGTQRGSWHVGPGQTVGPLTVYFETGFGSGGLLDTWSVLPHVRDGSTPVVIYKLCSLAMAAPQPLENQQRSYNFSFR